MDSIELLVGRVGRAHGIRGDVVVEVRTDEPDRRFAPGTAFETARGRLTVQRSHWHGQRLLLTFAEARDRLAAEALRGVELRITVDSDQRPDDPEEFYDHHLIGLRAQGVSGQVFGEVADVLHLPAQDVLVLRRDGREVLVPFVAELVPEVNVSAGTLVVVERPGLLDDEDAESAPATDAVADNGG